MGNEKVCFFLRSALVYAQVCQHSNAVVCLTRAMMGRWICHHLMSGWVVVEPHPPPILDPEGRSEKLKVVESSSKAITKLLWLFSLLSLLHRKLSKPDLAE